MATKNLDQLKETVALAHRTLFATGLTTSSGHASARIPGTGTFLIKPWPHIHMARLQAEDIITMDLDGNKLTGPDTVTRVSEWPIHAEIYRARPDVNAVIHTHQKWATMMGIAGKTILPVLDPDLAAVVGEAFPVFDADYSLIRRISQGRMVAEKLGKHIGAHLRTHGMVFAGPNLETATIDAIHAEYQAEITWLALQIGDPTTIPISSLQARMKQRGPDIVPEAWEHYYRWIDAHPESVRNRMVQL